MGYIHKFLQGKLKNCAYYTKIPAQTNAGSSIFIPPVQKNRHKKVTWPYRKIDRFDT